MSIIAKNTKRDFIPAPEGLWPAVCIDVVDIGMKETPWGQSHKVEVRWVISETMVNTGKPFMLVKRYTLSLHEKANLRRELETWRGKKFTDDELEGFDLEKLLGINCQLQIIHNQKGDGEVYANVQAIVPAARGMNKLMIPSDYVRAVSRNKQSSTQPDEIVDEDIPF